MVRYSLIYVGTKDRQLLTFIHLTHHFKPSVSSVESLCKSNVPESNFPVEDFGEIAEHMSALKLVSVFSLVSVPVKIRQKWSSVDVVRYQGSSDFRSFCDRSNVNYPFG